MPTFVYFIPLLILVSSVAHAQNLPATRNMFSSPNGLSTSGIFADPNQLNRRHMGPYGRPCIKTESGSKSETINPNIIEHWVSATNSCGQHVKLKICYYQTQHCVMVDVPPWDRKDTVLGIFPALRDFRYEFTEQFN